MKQSKFKPLMISFAKKEYEQEQEKATQKLELLDEASVWIHNTISPKKVDMKKLSHNMVAYFSDLILETFFKQNTLGLSAKELIRQKEISLFPLVDIQSAYQDIKMKVDFKNNEASIKVDRKDFEKWTTNEKQNKMLLTGNKFIGALNDMDKVREINKTFMSKEFVWRLTNGFVLFDVMSNNFFVNPEMLEI
jgi:hypothetical protein